MPLLVDTSVWSLAFRRNGQVDRPEVKRLASALTGGESILVTGLILQELLQGFRGAKAHQSIIERFHALPMLSAEREDHIQAAGLRNDCRRRGVQIGTVDALLAQLCLRHELTLLTTDHDFTRIAAASNLKIWT